MDWFKENKFISGLLAVVIIGSALLGFLLVNQRSQFAESQAKYQTEAKKVKQLRGRKLFPSEANLKLQQKEAESYSESVDRLHEKLLAYQRPFDEAMSDTGFQSLLTQKVLDVKSRAAREGVEMGDAFAFGFERYASELPRLDAVPELNFSLEAGDYLVGKLFDAGVEALLVMERDPLAIESKAVAAKGDDEEGEEDFYEEEREEEAAEDEESEQTQNDPIVIGKSGVLVRYPFKLKFRSGSDSIERFLEFVANTSKDSVFYNIKTITLDNSAKDGPARSGSSSRRRGSSAAAADDSQVVLGAETVETTVWIDAIRVNPIKDEDAGESDA